MTEGQIQGKWFGVRNNRLRISGVQLYIQALASLFLQKRLNAWFIVISDKRKSDKCFSLTKIPIQRLNLTYPVHNLIIFSP